MFLEDWGGWEQEEQMRDEKKKEGRWEKAGKQKEREKETKEVIEVGDRSRYKQVDG